MRPTKELAERHPRDGPGPVCPADLLEVLRTAEGGQFVNRLLTGALRALIDLEATAAIGAAPHEGTPPRTTRRNGSRPKTLTTAAGDVTVAIPKTRTGSFFPSLLEPGRRTDRVLHAVICEGCRWDYTS